MELPILKTQKNLRPLCDCSDFCHSDNVFICDLESNEYLRDNFESLLDVYTPINEMGRNYPKERADLIKNVLCSRSIFNLNPDGVYKFLISLLPEKYNEQPMLFDNPIGISGSVDEEYMNQYSILVQLDLNKLTI